MRKKPFDKPSSQFTKLNMHHWSNWPVGSTMQFPSSNKGKMSASCFQPQRTEFGSARQRQKSKPRYIAHAGVLLKVHTKSPDVTQGSHLEIHLHTQSTSCAKLLLKPLPHGYYCSGMAFTYDIILHYHYPSEQASEGGEMVRADTTTHRGKCAAQTED